MDLVIDVDARPIFPQKKTVVCQLTLLCIQNCFPRLWGGLLIGNFLIILCIGWTSGGETHGTRNNTFHEVPWMCGDVKQQTHLRTINIIKSSTQCNLVFHTLFFVLIWYVFMKLKQRSVAFFYEYDMAVGTGEEFCFRLNQGVALFV